MLPVPEHCRPADLYTKTGQLASVRQRTLAVRYAMQSDALCLWSEWTETLVSVRKRTYPAALGVHGARRRNRCWLLG